MSTPARHGRLAMAALRLSQRSRVLASGLFGAIAGGAAALVAPWQLAALGGWIVAAVVLGGSVWMWLPFLDATETHAAAMREDQSAGADDVIIISASVISLVGVLAALIAAGKTDGAERVMLIAGAVLTVVSSWFVVHTLYTLRYAHLYYDAPIGGIDFPQDEGRNEDPDYLDFAYLAFTIGMTFQVSDTDISQRTIRRTILRHALLAYLFGAIIVGVTINVVGTLVG